MDRRNFIQTTGLSMAAVLLSDSMFGITKNGNELLVNYPDMVTAIVNDLLVKLTGKENKWTYKEVVVTLINSGNGTSIEIQAPKVSVSAVTLHWKIPGKGTSKILNNHWAVSYTHLRAHETRHDLVCRLL